MKSGQEKRKFIDFDLFVLSLLQKRSPVSPGSRFLVYSFMIMGFLLGKRLLSFILTTGQYWMVCCATPKNVLVTMYRPIAAGVHRTKSPIITTKKIFIDPIILVMSGIASAPGSLGAAAGLVSVVSCIWRYIRRAASTVSKMF